MIHTVKGFGIVNKAEIDVFLEFSCFFDGPADVGNLISGSSALSFPGGSVVKHLQITETRVRSLGQEDRLEEEMATHSSILPGKSHGQRTLAGYSPSGC